MNCDLGSVLIGAILGAILGGIITWFFSHWYFVRAGEWNKLLARYLDGSLKNHDVCFRYNKKGEPVGVNVTIKAEGSAVSNGEATPVIISDGEK